MTEIKKVVTGAFQENCFIIFDPQSRDALLVDPGDDSEKITDTVYQFKLNPIAILNTHAHMDHIGAVDFLQHAFDIPFYLHQKEKIILESFEDSCRMFGLPHRNTPKVDYWLCNEESVVFKNLSFNVIFTPGHTPGGITFEIDGNIFVGDTLFRGSVGRTDLPGGDWAVLEQSLIKLMKKVDTTSIIHSGHGAETTLGEEMINNPFLIPLKNYLNS